MSSFKEYVDGNNYTVYEALSELEVVDTEAQIDKMELAITQLQSETTNLARRTQVLEARTNTQDALIENLDEKVDKLSTDVNVLTTEVDDLTTSVGIINNTVADLSENVTSLESSVEGLENDMVDLDARITALEKSRRNETPPHMAPFWATVLCNRAEANLWVREIIPLSTRVNYGQQFRANFDGQILDWVQFLGEFEQFKSDSGIPIGYGNSVFKWKVGNSVVISHVTILSLNMRNENPLQDD